MRILYLILAGIFGRNCVDLMWEVWNS